jgi:hypothetical protein
LSHTDNTYFYKPHKIDEIFGVGQQFVAKPN